VAVNLPWGSVSAEIYGYSPWVQSLPRSVTVHWLWLWTYPGFSLCWDLCDGITTGSSQN